MLDSNRIREKFPSLSREIYGKPLVYFDNAATTQSPKSVTDEYLRMEKEERANVHRGVHTLSQIATKSMENTREMVRRFINASSTREIIFTSGTTESINLVAYSLAHTFEDGDEIILSVAEHHSNIVPWQIANLGKNIVIKTIPLLSNGELDMKTYKNMFSKNTKFVSVAHISNVLGVVNPIEEIIKIAHTHNVPVLIDGAQAISHIPVDVKALDADFYVFSAHKMYGLTGVGVLYGKNELLRKMSPYKGGGAMIEHVSFDKTTFAELPYKFEAGTPNFVAISAFAKAIEFMDEIGIEQIRDYENTLTQYALEKLQKIPSVKIFGNAPHKSSVISFVIGNEHPYDTGMILDKLGFETRTGHHCAQPLMNYLGVEGTLRISFAVYNTIDEIDSFISALKRVISILGL